MGNVYDNNLRTQQDIMNRRAAAQFGMTSGTMYDQPRSSSAPSPPPAFPTFPAAPPAQWTPSPGGSGASGDGLFGGIGEGVGQLSAWMIDHIKPLQLAQAWGEKITEVGLRWRAVMGILGCLLGLGLLGNHGPGSLLTSFSMFLFEVMGRHAPLTAFLLGGVVGWNSFRLLGISLILAAGLTALSLALIVITLGLALVYSIIALFAGWTPISQWFS